MTLYPSFHFPSDNIFIFLTVGNFLIGLHLCERLLDDGSHVVALDRYNSNGSEGLEKTVNWFLEKTQVKDRGSAKYYV